MKQNVKKAWDQLKKIGAPVLDPDRGWGGHFAISAELYGCDNGYYEGHKDMAPNGFSWADYYEQSYAGPNEEFGVNEAILQIMKENDLYVEWYNPAVMCVHDV